MMRWATKQDAGNDFVSFDAHGHPCIGGRLTVTHLWLDGYTNTCRPAVIAEPDYDAVANKVTDAVMTVLLDNPTTQSEIKATICAVLKEVL